MAQPRTTTMAQILSYLATAPSAETSGAAISKACGIGSDRLYPAIHALEFDNLIIGCWEETPGPRRRLYSLTRAGRDQVGAMPPAQTQPSAGTGNWFWRTFVAPVFGG